MLLPRLSFAQTFSFSDTVYATVPGSSTGVEVNNLIHNLTSSPLTLRWKVIACNFPSDWLTQAAFGICDNKICYQNAPSAPLWNPSTSSGLTQVTNAYGDTTTSGPFHLALVWPSGTSNAIAYTTVSVTDPSSGYTKTMTFVVNKGFPAGIQPVKPIEEISLYPNPAVSEINVVYDASADVKNIAVYNIIGKVMSVYRVSGNSANLNLDNVPSGIYFLRLMNSNGQVVATRKFTKQ
jgi:hypothetical protein